MIYYLLIRKNENLQHIRQNSYVIFFVCFPKLGPIVKSRNLDLTQIIMQITQEIFFHLVNVSAVKSAELTFNIFSISCRSDPGSLYWVCCSNDDQFLIHYKQFRAISYWKWVCSSISSFHLDWDKPSILVFLSTFRWTLKKWRIFIFPRCPDTDQVVGYTF